MPKEGTQLHDKIDLHAAVAAAQHFFNDLYGSTPVSNVMLEEVEEQEGKWLITLGFDTVRDAPIESIAGLLIPKPKQTLRIYKTFVVDAKSGIVRSMRMHPSLTA